MRHDRSDTPPSAGRALRTLFDAVRLAYGLWLAMEPRQGAAVAGGGSVSDAEAAVARVLGWRHVVQALLSPRRSGAPGFAIGASVDAVHAATMALAATVMPDHRRELVVDATAATILAVAGTALHCERNRSTR